MALTLVSGKRTGQARARVYGGIHFNFDNVAGQSAGRNVANYIFANVMRQRQCVR